ncbi:tail fiber assembly protein, partial [Escherichia coli]|nr:tail fiber assembly protein [Escherichia coli]
MSNTAVLDENGIATVAGDITVYHYDEETREYTSSSVEYLALGVGTPAHSCADAPPEAISGYVVCRTATLNGWEHVPDHRGETVYSTENGNPVLITQPGDYPADTTTKQPATPWDTWNGEAWVTDTERQRTAELEVARQ